MKTPCCKEILDDYHHGVINPFLRKYGRFYCPQDLPTRFRRGRWRACFQNSYNMARHHGVVYVEGVAIFIVDGRPHLHAWCADSEGRVLDRTRDDGICYFGVPVRIDFLQAVIFGRIRRLGEPYFGLLDDWQGGYFLINQLGNEPEKWLAE